jgi:hypothetical protein
MDGLSLEKPLLPDDNIEPPSSCAKQYRNGHGQGRQRGCRGMVLPLANGVVIGVIIYLMLELLASLVAPCRRTQTLSLPDAEKIILESPSPAFLRSQSRYYASGAHLAGKNYTQATYTQALWQSYGIHAEIEEYEVLLNYPVSHRIALLNPNGAVEYEAELGEDVVPEDSTSVEPDTVPTFHGYSANGNVTGELVYANFGQIEDFRLLEKMGVNVSGKVVIVRYGTTFRGLKVKAAQGKTQTLSSDG